MDALIQLPIGDPVLKVIGVGGGGINAIDAMIEAGVRGAEFIAIGTDTKSLQESLAPVRIQLGRTLLKGLGAGANPAKGQAAAEEDAFSIASQLKGADMVFVAAGMGGGTGTGAAPVIAALAKKAGALVVGVVTVPFFWEGKLRATKAAAGLEQLKKSVDCLIVIPNDRLLSSAAKGTTVVDAFRPADDVLRQAVQAITELISEHGYINADFNDVKTIMAAKGQAIIGIGVASGENGAESAVAAAISCPLLEDVDLAEAKGVLVNITGGPMMTMNDFDTITRVVNMHIGEDTEVITGVVVRESDRDEIAVTLIATGIPW